MRRTNMTHVTVLLVAVMVLMAGCSSGATDTTTTLITVTTAPPMITVAPGPVRTGPPFEVSSTIVSHETTQDISVWAPDAEGSWPIVYLLHGYQGSGQDLVETATGLASQGVVVFAADYRSTAEQYIEHDAECGWRYAVSIADEYGGDLDQPVTFVGDSMGASLVLTGGLTNSVYGPDGTYDECFIGAPRPDVIVPIAGCHYGHDGEQSEFDLTGWDNLDADLVLVVGEDDVVCPAWQSEEATTALRSAGYEANLVVVPGGNHNNVVFYDVVDGEWVIVPNDPVGEVVVQTILDAINAAQS